MNEDVSAARQSSGNQAQIDYWNSRAGEVWARNQARLDRAFEPLMRILIEQTAPAAGERILDVGCGCGALALALAPRVGAGGRVIGADISRPMLERAQMRARALVGDHAPITWLEADAAAHEFAAENDLLVSRFGVMFFADPVAAFRNLRRALKPGGRFAFLCWAELDLNPWLAVPMQPMRELLGPQPPSDLEAPGPFALSKAARMEAILREAGFADFSAVTVEAPLVLGRAEPGADPKASAIADALELSLRTGPAAALLREADDATKQEAHRRVGDILAPFFVDGEIRLAGTSWLYTGSNPA